MSVGKGIVNIRGKDYQTVPLRIAQFRKQHPDYGIITEIIDNQDNSILMKATVIDNAGFTLGTGHAWEEKKGNINASNGIENCETSAIGRALASCGYLSESFASAEEMVNTRKQIAKIGVDQAKWIRAMLKDNDIDQDAFNSFLLKNRCNSIEDINESFFETVQTMIQKKVDNA